MNNEKLISRLICQVMHLFAFLVLNSSQLPFSSINTLKDLAVRYVGREIRKKGSYLLSFVAVSVNFRIDLFS